MSATAAPAPASAAAPIPIDVKSDAALTAVTPPAAAAAGSALAAPKTLYLIRHGESEMNAHRKAVLTWYHTHLWVCARPHLDAPVFVIDDIG
jgi:hypothetical protein